jgi:alpha-beta hydrolase superfamily lysophospholipase
LAAILYAAFSIVVGIFVADGSLRPARRPLADDDAAAMRERARALGVEMQEESVTAGDGTVLRAWRLRPPKANGNEVIALHGLGDNRLGTRGYAELFLARGYTVLMPDARAHGVSGGSLATYGLMERDDIARWFELLEASDHPGCVFGFGESMGAAQMLQSLPALKFCAVVAESPFATFREIAYDRMGQPFHLGPWVGRTLLRPVVEIGILRARWKFGLDMDAVSPEHGVQASAVPVLLIHGQEDSNIPVRHSRMIHERNLRTELWEVPGADHCGALSAAPQEFERKVMGWFAEHDAVSKK